MSVETSLRWKIYHQLEDQPPDKRGLTLTNWAILFLILLSLILYTAETEREIGIGETSVFWFLNIVILVIFGFEFGLRLYVAGIDDNFKGWSGLSDYAKSNWLMMTVDFLAFAPELFLLAIGFSPPSWLRALRVVRLFKMARYFRAFKLVVDAVRSCMQELLAALAVAVMLWYLASVLLYLAESTEQPEKFGSITRSMWWSVVTLTTIGYGDVFPVTVSGKIIAGFMAVLGVGAVAMPSGILAGAFMDRFRDKRQTMIDGSEG